MEFLGEENIDLLLEVCEDMKISRDTLTNYAKIFYDATHGDITMTDIMERNKSFLLHMNQQSSTIGIYNKKEDDVVTPLVQYTNEFALKIPPQPSFLDTYEPNNEELDVLIQQKLNERDIELMEIQKLYNPDDKIESVKLIKISEVLAELDVFSNEDDIPNVNEVNRQKVTIGDTVVYNYNNYDPPEQLNNRDDKMEELFNTLKSIIENMNVIDKKLDVLNVIDKKLDVLNISIQTFINT
jgi:hypothetical protein